MSNCFYYETSGDNCKECFDTHQYMTYSFISNFNPSLTCSICRDKTEISKDCSGLNSSDNRVCDTCRIGFNKINYVNGGDNYQICLNSVELIPNCQNYLFNGKCQNCETNYLGFSDQRIDSDDENYTFCLPVEDLVEDCHWIAKYRLVCLECKTGFFSLDHNHKDTSISIKAWPPIVKR